MAYPLPDPDKIMRVKYFWKVKNTIMGMMNDGNAAPVRIFQLPPNVSIMLANCSVCTGVLDSTAHALFHFHPIHVVKYINPTNLDVNRNGINSY
jgi:hypothetical protein